MVEMARVELASESISARFSPSAATDLSFAFSVARWQAKEQAIP